MIEATALKHWYVKQVEVAGGDIAEDQASAFARQRGFADRCEIREGARVGETAGWNGIAQGERGDCRNLGELGFELTIKGGEQDEGDGNLRCYEEIA